MYPRAYTCVAYSTKRRGAPGYYVKHTVQATHQRTTGTVTPHRGSSSHVKDAVVEHMCPEALATCAVLSKKAWKAAIEASMNSAHDIN
jgi:hypothetical protein